jgi:hypothetical protein
MSSETPSEHRCEYGLIETEGVLHECGKPATYKMIGAGLWVCAEHEPECSAHDEKVYGSAERRSNKDLIQAAREMLLFTYNVDRDLVDDGIPEQVSRSEDGAWVPMWIWVSNRDEVAPPAKEAAIDGKSCAEHINVERIRAKIAARKNPCSSNCPGWAVYNVDIDPVLQSCDECWSEVEQPLCDEEIELLPEAQQELSLAINDGNSYDNPKVGPPCKCGCVVQRQLPASCNSVCSGCGAVLPPLPVCERYNPIFVAALAAMDRAEELNGPEGEDYINLMRAIENEARGRRERYQGKR